MSRLKRLIAEVHRRSLWQVLLVYVGAAYAVLEATDLFIDRIGLPDWVFQSALVLLVIGLPLVMLTALVQAGGPIRTRQDPTLLPGDEGGAQASSFARLRGLFTWRNAMLSGLFAFALLGIGTAGYMAMRVMGIGPAGSLLAKGVLAERERIVVADFDNQTPDSLLGRAATEALRIGLSQSPVIRVAEPAYLSRILDRMQVEPDDPLDHELAREVAIREGLKAIVAGRIVSAGESYLVSVRLIEAEEGEILASYAESVADASELIPTIDRLSKKLRGRVGESLKTIRSSQPLERVTTHSLAALQRYSQARHVLSREGDWSRGIALLEDAIRMDPDFAGAYAALATWLWNLGAERARAVQARRRAYELADRLPDRERYIIIAGYHGSVTGEHEKAIVAYRNLLDIDPAARGPLNNLGVIHFNRREFDRAVEYYRRAIDSDSSVGFLYGNLIEVQVALGEFEAAERTFEARARNTRPYPYLFAAHLEVARRDYETARAAVEAWRTDDTNANRGPAAAPSEARRALALLVALRGRVAEAEEQWSEVMALDRQRNLPREYLKDAAQLAGWQVWLRDARDRGLATVEGALELYPLDSMAPFDWPVVPTRAMRPIEPMLPALYAFAYEPDRARPIIAAYEAEVDPELRKPEELRLRGLHGLVALAEGRYTQAIEDLRAWDDGTPCTICVLPHLGRAYDRAGQPDSALAIYERYVTTPWLWRLASDAFHLAWVYERLGELYEQRGDTDKAVYYYGKLVELWKDADPELQPRVEAARRAIAALSPDP